MKVLVTGGGGFLGQAVVRQLQERRDDVRTFQRGSYPFLAQMGVQIVRGDLLDREAVREALRGREAVIHLAAKVGVWGKRKDFYRANVLGTHNVVELCKQCGVRKLVYTSSPSVVFTGRDDPGLDSSAPYPARYLSPYPETKALAERFVLENNSAELATLSLRPHLVWGPGDTHIVPQIIQQARKGRLRLVGKGENLVDSTYIDNAAKAHLLAVDRLNPGTPCAGKAYFVSNGEPLPMGVLLRKILRAASLSIDIPSISPSVAYAMGAALEKVYGLLRISRQPAVTRFLAREFATAHWFDISATRRDLEYEPSVSIEEGLNRLARWLQAPAVSAL